MAQGLQCWNDGNLVQIDGTIPNLVLITKGGVYNSVTVYSPNFPLFFIRPQQGAFIWLRDNGGGSYTFNCQGYFDYWVFSNNMDNGSQRFGLQVFNESGALVYGSSDKMLRPSRVVTLIIPQGPPPPGQGYSGGGLPFSQGMVRVGNLATYAGFPHNNFAFNFSDLAGLGGNSLTNTGGSTIWSLAMVARVINGGFVVDEYSTGFSKGFPQNPRPFKANPQIFAVDVTNV